MTRRIHRPSSVPRHHLQVRGPVKEGSERILLITGDVDLQTAPQLRERILAAAEEGASVVLDLRGVRFMDSPGLGTVIFCHQALAGAGSTLVARAPQSQVRDLFEMVQLDTIIEID
jgi:anti-sigma B factor antagonist